MKTVSHALVRLLAAAAGLLCLNAGTPAQQCSTADFEFVGTSPPFADSNAILLLHVADKGMRFTANDSLGDSDTGETHPAQFNCFAGGSSVGCASAGVDRVVFTLQTADTVVQGDVLLASYGRAVVDLVRARSQRVRYLLKPCLCSTTQASSPGVAVSSQIASTRAINATPKRIAALSTVRMPAVAAAPAGALNVWQIATPDVSAARVTALASQVFGFNGAVVETPGTFQINETVQPGRSLLLYKSSGVMEFVDTSKYQAPTYRPNLPDERQAVGLARAFLHAHGLLPPNPTVETRTETISVKRVAVPNAVGISFEGRLRVNATTEAPVREGEVVVWLGNGGEVIRLHKNFRDVVSPPVPVAPRPVDQVRAELAARVRTLSGLTVKLAYVSFDPENEEPYLDPVLEATDSDGNPAARARATTFTPRPAVIGPDPNVPVPAPGSTQLRATASDGTPPYRFMWQSNLDGFLGEGDVLPVQLSAGQHRIDLTLRDANDAGVGGSLLFSVAPGDSSGATAVAPSGQALVRAAAAAEVIADNTRISVSNGVSFSVASQEARPIVLNSVDKGGIRRARNIYFDQVWYEIDVFVSGPTFYTLKSGKCRVRKTAGVNACAQPTAPFAQSSGTTPLNHDGTKALVTTSGSIANLPGILRFEFEYAGVDEFCGPEPDFLAGSLLWIANAGGLAYPLGGTCAGLRPTVKWTYEPPCDKSISGAEIQQFCTQGENNCNIPADTLAGLDRSKRYFMREFRAKLSTAIQPPLTTGTDVSSFVKDGNSETDALVKTDGNINRTLQPFWAPEDAFVFIDAVANERVATASKMGSRGDFDNVHIKEGVSLGVYFPGCNNPQFKGKDQLPCIHLHENWLNQRPGVNKTYSEGQVVNWYDVVFRAGAEESPNGPASITNGEALSRVVPGLKFPIGTAEQALWVESTAASKDCAPPGAFGGLDNTDRPCVVFPQALFFTPR
jgi:hypothetical protein